jgi:hypothetical protein
MTYAAFDHAMMYFWAAWFVVLVGFLLWAIWVWLIDEPRVRHRKWCEAKALLARIQPRDP